MVRLKVEVSCKAHPHLISSLGPSVFLSFHCFTPVSSHPTPIPKHHVPFVVFFPTLLRLVTSLLPISFRPFLSLSCCTCSRCLDLTTSPWSCMLVLLFATLSCFFFFPSTWGPSPQNWPNRQTLRCIITKWCATQNDLVISPVAFEFVFRCAVLLSHCFVLFNAVPCFVLLCPCCPLDSLQVASI